MINPPPLNNSQSSPLALKPAVSFAVVGEGFSAFVRHFGAFMLAAFLGLGVSFAMTGLSLYWFVKEVIEGVQKEQFTLQRGIEIIQRELLQQSTLMVLGTISFLLVACFSSSICHITLKGARGGQIRGRDVFFGFRHNALRVIGASIALGIASWIGYSAFFVMGLVVTGLFLTVIPALSDEQNHRSLGDAFSHSWRHMSAQFVTAVLIGLVTFLLTAAGGIFFGLGLLVTMPICLAIQTLVYRDCIDGPPATRRAAA